MVGLSRQNFSLEKVEKRSRVQLNVSLVNKLYLLFIFPIKVFVSKYNCSEMGSAAERGLTWTVVSLGSSSCRLCLVSDPPVKVVILVLGKLAGFFPFVIIHVEITRTWQAKGTVYKTDMEKKKAECGLKVVFLLCSQTDSLPMPKKSRSHFYSPQSISSDSSAQSALLSHTRWDSMQSPL